jgi:hypothetical protein
MSQEYAIAVNPASLGASVDNATPTGTIDGSNLVFTLADIPSAGTLKVRADGVVMRNTVDYTLAGAVITFIAIAPTQWVECDYKV